MLQTRCRTLSSKRGALLDSSQEMHVQHAVGTLSPLHAPGCVMCLSCSIHCTTSFEHPLPTTTETPGKSEGSPLLITPQLLKQGIINILLIQPAILFTVLRRSFVQDGIPHPDLGCTALNPGRANWLRTQSQPPYFNTRFDHEGASRPFNQLQLGRRTEDVRKRYSQCSGRYGFHRNRQISEVRRKLRRTLVWRCKSMIGPIKYEIVLMVRLW
jgi:hypothetical protein